MARRQTSKSQKIIRTSVIVSGLCLALCLAFFAVSTYTRYAGGTVSDVQTMPSPQFLVNAYTAESTSVESAILDLAADDLHYFILQAEGTASTGYCQVTVTNGNDTDTYYISPIAQGRTVSLVVQAASGSAIVFASSGGTPPTDDPDMVVEPSSRFSRGADAALTACLEISHTPSIEYTVPEGVILESMAGFYGVSPADILTYNSIDSIAPGDGILIPNPVTEAYYDPPQAYTVQEGDTLPKIAQSCNVTVKSLCQWNNIEMDAILYAGMELTIPVPLENPVEPETQPSAEMEAAAPESMDIHSADRKSAEAQPVETEATEAEDNTVYVNGVPRYFQTDYPEDFYANGTIATSGCSVTSLTMVANAVTGYDYTVDELADYFGGRAENNMARLELGSEKLGLSFYKSENWDMTLKALNEGKIVIALMEETSLFTDSQHFIVLTGLNEDGKIMVNDPNEYNYSVWELKNAFENGFTPNDILLGYSGAWVYERTLLENPPRYSEPRLDKSEENKNYPIKLTVQERELLARVIWVEAQGECAEGQQAVAEVVFNRMLSDQFGDTLNDVIYGKDAFRSVPYLEDAKPTQAQYEAIDQAMYGTPVLDQNVFYFATYATNSNIYKQIGNHIFCYGA